MPDVNKYEDVMNPDAFADHLNGLHRKLLSYTDSGELLFRETRSEKAARAKSPWARAEFGEGGLRAFMYTRAPEVEKGHTTIHTFLYDPAENPGRQVIHSSQHIDTNGVLYDKTEYIEHPTALVEEMTLFIFQSLSTVNYDRTPPARPKKQPNGRWQKLATKARNAGMSFFCGLGAFLGQSHPEGRP